MGFSKNRTVPVFSFLSAEEGAFLPAGKVDLDLAPVARSQPILLVRGLYAERRGAQRPGLPVILFPFFLYNNPGISFKDSFFIIQSRI